MIHDMIHRFILPQKDIFPNLFVLKLVDLFLVSIVSLKILRFCSGHDPRMVQWLSSPDCAADFLERGKFEGESRQDNTSHDIPSTKLTYPTLGKGKSSSKSHSFGDMLVPWRVTWLSDTSKPPKFKPKLEESSKAHVGNGHADQKVCSITLLLFPDAKSCAEKWLLPLKLRPSWDVHHESKDIPKDFQSMTYVTCHL